MGAAGIRQKADSRRRLLQELEKMIRGAEEILTTQGIGGWTLSQDN